MWWQVLAISMHLKHFIWQASPHTGKRIDQQKQSRALTRSVRQVLEQAIAAGGTSLRDHVQPGGEIGYFSSNCMYMVVKVNHVITVRNP